ASLVPSGQKSESSVTKSLFGRNQNWRSGSHRQADRELRPLADFALHVDRAVVGFDDPLGRWQPEAGAATLGFGGKEWAKDLRQYLRGDAGAGVDQGKADVGTIGRRLKRQFAAVGHRLHGVQHQIE